MHSVVELSPRDVPPTHRGLPGQSCPTGLRALVVLRPRSVEWLKVIHGCPRALHPSASPSESARAGGPNVQTNMCIPLLGRGPWFLRRAPAVTRHACDFPDAYARIRHAPSAAEFCAVAQFDTRPAFLESGRSWGGGGSCVLRAADPGPVQYSSRRTRRVRRRSRARSLQRLSSVRTWIP